LILPVPPAVAVCRAYRARRDSCHDCNEMPPERCVLAVVRTSHTPPQLDKSWLGRLGPLPGRVLCRRPESFDGIPVLPRPGCRQPRCLASRPEALRPRLTTGLPFLTKPHRGRPPWRLGLGRKSFQCGCSRTRRGSQLKMSQYHDVRVWLQGYSGGFRRHEMVLAAR
jgi:hypothetical protein